VSNTPIIVKFGIGDWVEIRTVGQAQLVIDNNPDNRWRGGNPFTVQSIMHRVELGWYFYGKSLLGWGYASDPSAFTPGHMGWLLL
jgi:hypothetical protein